MLELIVCVEEDGEFVGQRAWMHDRGGGGG